MACKLPPGTPRLPQGLGGKEGTGVGEDEGSDSLMPT